MTTTPTETAATAATAARPAIPTRTAMMVIAGLLVMAFAVLAVSLQLVGASEPKALADLKPLSERSASIVTLRSDGDPADGRGHGSQPLPRCEKAEKSTAGKLIESTGSSCWIPMEKLAD